LRETQKAIVFFKNRLDVHSAITQYATIIKRYDIVGEQVIKILEISKEIDHDWMDGTKKFTTETNRKKFLLDKLQSIIAMLMQQDIKF
jgi:hypothetical protein